MHLFFYGILQGDIAEGPVRDLLAGIGPGKPATASGQLYAVRNEAGAYPAMIDGDGEVHGMMHEAGSVDLDALDVFEGAEYRRVPVPVTTDEQTAIADAYVWVGSVADLEPIAHGRFPRWLRENGLSAYSAES
jgi:gamma-glutamylcyclotransferase (GGCT)/AIG2-like uncharacterized protein YtfP